MKKLKRIATTLAVLAFGVLLWTMQPASAEAATLVNVQTPLMVGGTVAMPQAMLVDTCGHAVYLNQECTQQALAKDYVAGKQYYCKTCTSAGAATTTTTANNTAAATTTTTTTTTSYTNPWAALLAARQQAAATSTGTATTSAATTTTASNPLAAYQAAQQSALAYQQTSSWQTLLAQRQAMVAQWQALYGSGLGITTAPMGTCVDVSKHQGGINWSQVRASGMTQAMVRCGGRYRQQRTIYADEYYYSNVAGAASSGMAVGSYFYSTATNTQEAAEEAAYAVQCARASGNITRGIYIDIEDSIQAGLSTDQRTQICQTFCNTVQAAGYSAGVYASYKWWTTMLNASALQNYNVWIARYNNSLGYPGKVNIWQYTSSGSVSGISGRVDMNVVY